MSISSSIIEMKELFEQVANTAESAQKRFYQEGRAYYDASKQCGNRKNAEEIRGVCNAFADLRNRFKDTTGVSNLLREINNEKDRALQAQKLHQLKKYVSNVPEKAFRHMEHDSKAYSSSNIADESNIKTLNDEVRLINSDAYQAYVRAINRKSETRPQKTSLKAKKKRVQEEMCDSFEGKLKYSLGGSPKNKWKIMPFDNVIMRYWDAALNGLKCYAIIGTILLVAALFVLAGYKEDLVDFMGSQLYQIVFNIITAPLYLVFQVFEGDIGSTIYGFMQGVHPIVLWMWEMAESLLFPIVIIIVGIIEGTIIGTLPVAIYCLPFLLYDIVLLIPQAICFVICAIRNIRNKMIYKSELKERRKVFKPLFDQNYDREFDRRLKELEAQEEREQHLFVPITQATQAYYREIARVASTSQPIVSVEILKEINIIRTYLNRIDEKIKNIAGLSNCSMFYESNDVFSYYDIIARGEVNTLEQARRMVDNMRSAENERERRRKEAERRAEEARRKQQEKEEEERRRREAYEDEKGWDEYYKFLSSQEEQERKYIENKIIWELEEISKKLDD